MPDNTGYVIAGVGALGIGGLVLYELTKKQPSATSTPVTSTYTPVLTTIKWSGSPLNLPNTGGVVLFSASLLDQNSNPYAYDGSKEMLSLFEQNTNQQVGDFPFTTNGKTSFSLTIPAAVSTSPESFVFDISVGVQAGGS